MARTDVKYDEESIQTSTVVISKFEHESLDNKTLDIQQLGKDDGGKVVSEIYSPKQIVVGGTIFGTSKADLEANVDEFKRLVNQQNKPLDIEYSSGWRRYKTYSSNIDFIRPRYALEYADFEVTFVVAHQPFGQSLDTSTITQVINTISTSTIQGTYCFLGTRRPLPKIQATITSETDLAQITFNNTTTGDAIIITRDFVAGEVLIIDTENYTVTVDNVAVEYEGIFPEFAQSCNTFKIGVRADACNISVKFIYNQLFL